MTPDPGTVATTTWRGTLLLAAGALCGVVIAAAGIVSRDPGPPAVPAGAVAVVNGAPIQAADYQRALAAVASGRRDGAVGPLLRRHVLERLIDEELLVQRGLELRLAEKDPMARTYLSAAVINLVVSRGEDDIAPADDELRRFYDDNRDYFRHDGRLRAEQIFFRIGQLGRDGARHRADQAARALAEGAEFAQVAAHGDPPAAILPSTPLRPEKLRDYLGPTVTSALEALAPGEFSPPIESSDGFHIVHLIDREAARVPPFDSVRGQVLAEYRRREGDRRVQQLLAERRARAEIAISAEAL